MENIKVNIIQNGITTLHTAGKYCPTNVDVVVSVPAGGQEELAAQQAIEDSIINGTLNSYSNDRVTEIGNEAFSAKLSLISISCPNVKRVYNKAFCNCVSLTQVHFPALETIHDGAFSYCSTLACADFPRLEYIEMCGFECCANLTKLILRHSQVCTLGDTMSFDYTPIASGTGYIYVPDELVEQYKAATNWSVYASQIRPISELEE